MCLPVLHGRTKSNSQALRRSVLICILSGEKKRLRLRAPLASLAAHEHDARIPATAICVYLYPSVAREEQLLVVGYWLLVVGGWSLVSLRLLRLFAAIKQLLVIGC